MPQPEHCTAHLLKGMPAGAAYLHFSARMALKSTFRCAAVVEEFSGPFTQHENSAMEHDQSDNAVRLTFGFVAVQSAVAGGIGQGRMKPVPARRLNTHNVAVHVIARFKPWEPFTGDLFGE
ncbi:hypothetical protein [Xylella fastidiosa]|uniref:hypothetical protein n=1 Tax=Xylella fastidiosa TaxID=2371 RepID=UPI001F392AD7|nr:hypothetical protein [Xylella fastidiosa]